VSDFEPFEPRPRKPVSPRALIIIGALLILTGLLAYGWSDDPATNFVVGTVPFWGGVIMVGVGVSRRRRQS
jgi:hypothetical protein